MILSDNLISLFQPNSFSFLPNLTEIYLSKNLIRKLNFQFAFEFKLLMLKTLDFIHNKIDFIDGENFFSTFPNLECLDLTFNELHSLERTFFLCVVGKVVASAASTV